MLTRPYEVLNPTTPQCALGMRTEPPSSLPTEPKHSPAETAAAESGRGPARDTVLIPGVAGRTETTGRPGTGECHFVQIQLAQEDCASSLQALRDLRVFGGDSILKHPGGRGCLNSRCVDVVLESYRNAIQAARSPSGLSVAIALSRLLQCGIAIERNECVELSVQFVRCATSRAWSVPLEEIVLLASAVAASQSVQASGSDPIFAGAAVIFAATPAAPATHLRRVNGSEVPFRILRFGIPHGAL